MSGSTPSQGLAAYVPRHRILEHEEVVGLARQYRDARVAETELEELTLTDDEIRDRRLLIRRGHRARERIAVHNLRLVADIAKRYRVDGLTFDDHFQNGCTGLLRAVEKFNPEAGFRFSTYATWWIRQSIVRGIADTARLIRLPVHVVDDLRRLEAARQRLLSATGRATRTDLASATGLSVDKVEQLIRLLPGPASLDGLVGDGLTTLGEMIPGPDGEAADEVKEIVVELLATLDERERRVMVLRFGLDGSVPQTLEQVGQEFGVTRERIRQIEARAFKRLRPAAADALGRSPSPPPPSPHGGDAGEAASPEQDPALQGSHAPPAQAVSSLLRTLTPRGQRLLDELARCPQGLDTEPLLAAMGLPENAPARSLVFTVNVELTRLEIEPIEVTSAGLVRGDPAFLETWTSLRRSA